jgi:hypothetical protein
VGEKPAPSTLQSPWRKTFADKITKPWSLTVRKVDFEHEHVAVGEPAPKKRVFRDPPRAKGTRTSRQTTAPANHRSPVRAPRGDQEGPPGLAFPVENDQNDARARLARVLERAENQPGRGKTVNVGAVPGCGEGVHAGRAHAPELREENRQKGVM